MDESFIMFLRNAKFTKEDTPEHIMDETLTESSLLNSGEYQIQCPNGDGGYGYSRSETHPHPSIVYDKIPEIYNKKTWPTHTNLKCCNCTLSIPGYPIPLARELIRNSAEYIGLTFYTLGIFCSCSCAARHVDVLPTTMWHCQRVLCMTYSELYGIQPMNIVKARSKMSMTAYGGELSETEYRASIEETEAMWA